MPFLSLSVTNRDLYSHPCRGLPGLRSGWTVFTVLHRFRLFVKYFFLKETNDRHREAFRSHGRLFPRKEPVENKIGRAVAGAKRVVGLRQHRRCAFAEAGSIGVEVLIERSCEELR